MPDAPPEVDAQQNLSAAPTKYVFFVYIVESPSAPDLYHGRSEGALVASALALDQIPCVSRTAINRQAFEAALQIGLPEAMKQFAGRYPILHLSAHGASDGIQLSSGDIIGWAELRELLVPINESLGGALLLCMSACKGYSACRMAMQHQDDAKHPYFAMVGNFGQPTWSDTAVSYLAFYHLLAKGRSIPEGVGAMNATSGDQSWTAESAEETRQSFIEFLKTKSEPQEAQRELEAVADLAELSPDAKALESGVGG
ncbi:MAG: hypothetical protein IPL75_00445 [Acidobacteria bacterium]|nr:hypothetical protein [Acidobacteriota bacterium]